MKFFRRLSYLKNKINIGLIQRALIIISFLIIAYFVFTSSLFAVSKFEITIPSTKSGLSEQVLELCISSYKGKNIFSLNTVHVVESLLSCSPLVAQAKVTKILPATITLVIEEINPVIKFKYLESCYLVDSNVVIRQLGIEACTKNEIPEIVGEITPENIILVSAVTDIDRQLFYLKEERPIKYEILYNSDSYFLKSVYDTYTTLSSPALSVESYITLMINTKNGLRERGETFSEIDLRFDRVIVR